MEVALNFDSYFKLKLFDTDFALTIGPSIGYIIRNNFLGSFYIIGDEGIPFNPDRGDECVVRYEDNYRRIIWYDDEIPDIKSFYMTLNFGVQYELDLWIAEISPYLNFSYGIVAITGGSTGDSKCKACYNDDIDWRLNSFGGGIAIQFKL